MGKICDAVFEGGGMRGIGHVGAIYEFEHHGYKFRNVAGSSAGAIVASLLAAGYTANELYSIIATVDFNKFKHSQNWYVRFGRLGRLVSVKRNLGIYNADRFEQWLAQLLAKKNVHTFADITNKLKLIATDITTSSILVLPDDLSKFGIDPNTFNIATAVRMSMSIPIFYEPYELKDQNGNIHLIADGGILSNHPIWVLDDGLRIPTFPIFGFRFERRTTNTTSTERPTLLPYLKQVIQTVMDDEDVFLPIIRGDRERTTFIPTRVNGKNIRSTDFDLNQNQIKGLFNNGRTSAKTFLNNWNFENWKQANRMTRNYT